MWQRINHWLRQVPVNDPVDRRNAPFLQLLMMAVGVLAPLDVLVKWIFIDRSEYNLHERIDWVTDNVMGAQLAISSWVGLALIRHGRILLAERVFLGSMLLMACVSYVVVGLASSPQNLLTAMMLVFAGLLLGRKALWGSFVALALSLGVGCLSDEVFAHPSFKISYLASFDGPKLLTLLLIYFAITITIDRTVSALRDSLNEARLRTAQLQREIVERERAQSQLIHAQKMEAVGRLAGGVAHDFNNILGVILGYTTERERLDDPDPNPRKDTAAMADALEGIETAARRAAKISHRLLRFSRSDVKQRKGFDVVPVVQDLLPMLRQLFGSQVDVAFDVANGEALWIYFDRSQFELMLFNLAANARDAMPAGGHFRIAASRESTEDNRVILTICDDGTGMSAEVRTRIFEPFYTTKPIGSGTGLGLAVTYSLVSEADGDIDVDSAPGQGTSFRISLPWFDPSLRLDDASHTSPDMIRVLLVEDDEELRNLLADVLRSDGCEVMTAGAAEDAKTYAAASTDIHVVICDQHALSSDRGDLHAELHRLRPNTPMIMISSAHRNRGGALSYSPYVFHLPKPFSPELLLATLHRVVGETMSNER